MIRPVKVVEATAVPTLFTVHVAPDPPVMIVFRSAVPPVIVIPTVITPPPEIVVTVRTPETLIDPVKDAVTYSNGNEYKFRIGVKMLPSEE